MPVPGGDIYGLSMAPAPPIEQRPADAWRRVVGSAVPRSKLDTTDGGW
jgi:hypothetical protein